MANRRPPRGEGKGRGPARPPQSAGSPRPAKSPRPARSSASKTRREEPADGLERLQKVLAHAGVGSRRACEELILQGRVTVDNQVVRELGTRVDPQKSKVALDGQRIQPERMVYFAVSKPKGYVSTNNDPSGRPRVVDLLPEIPQRVYTVGRLDEMSMGLILLTNDGELANKLAHPKFGVEKLYRAVVAGTPDRDVLNKLTEGVWLAEGKVKARRVRVVGKKGQATVLEMVLAEGKNREVRRMLAKLGHKVMSLTRIAVGPITLKGLTPGQFRPLSRGEIDLLQKVAAGIVVAPTRFSANRSTNSSRRPRPVGSGDSGPRDREEGPSGPPRYSAGPPKRRSSAPPAAGARRPTSSGGPRNQGGGGQGYRSGPGSRPPRPEGLPPSQRRAASSEGGPREGGSRRPGSSPPSRSQGGGGQGYRPGPSGASSRPPRPEGLPPSQRRSAAGEGPVRRSQVTRPEGPPPSQRRPPAGSGPNSSSPPGDEPPTRRIIGLDAGSEARRPRPPRPSGGRRPLPKPRFPRASPGPRPYRPSDDGEE